MERNLDHEKEHGGDQTAAVCAGPASRDHRSDFGTGQEQIERNAALARQGIGVCATTEPAAAAAAVTQLTNVLKSAMNDTKAEYSRAEQAASSLRDIAKNYVTTNRDGYGRKVEDVISRQKDALAQLDRQMKSATTNAQMGLETAILRGDKPSSLNEIIANQSAGIRQIVTQSSDRLHGVRTEMQMLGTAIEREATDGLEYTWSKDVTPKGAEAGVVTVTVQAGRSGYGMIKLPDDTTVNVTFETTRAGNVRNWTATCTGSDVKVVRPEGAVNQGNFFAATVLRDGGTTTITNQQTSESKKSLEGKIDVPLKVVTVGGGANASWGDSKANALARTANHQTSTSFGIRVIVESAKPPVEVWNGNKRTIGH